MARYSIEPPKNLLEKIMRRIHKERQILETKRKIAMFSILVAFSLAVFPHAINFLAQETLNSGFMHFFSLVFTDSEIIVNYFSNFMLSLTETLPSVGMFLFFSSLLVFLWSARNLYFNIKKMSKINYGY